MPSLFSPKKSNYSETLLARVARLLPLRPRRVESPFRADLYGLDQLATHAKSIAEQHKIGVVTGRNRLLSRLDENEKILRAYNRSTLEIEDARRITPAAEWLLDNFYLIEEQIQMSRRHLPRRYSRELPRLVTGSSAKLPRVYDLVLELIAHVDAEIDAEHLSAFVAAYQTVTPLRLGELWAIPIMLRLGLIENLRRIAARLSADRLDRDLADFWADRLQECLERDASNLIVGVADMARADFPTSSAFVTQFCQRLSKMDPAVHFARQWLEQRLAEQGVSVEQRILMESQGQAADQVSISHTIGSLRFLSATDWRDFVESLSIVHQTLCEDPAGVFPEMDFSTRDSYRHSVEEFSRYSKLSQNEVARQAIALAKNGAALAGAKDRAAHVGFYLVDKGRPEMERATKVHWPFNTSLERGIRRFPLSFYMGSITAFTIPATLLLVAFAQDCGIQGWRLALLGLAACFGLSQLAVTLVNLVTTLVVFPRRLPRLDFSGGIRADCKTMVVVPTMLASSQAIERLIETLEIHYLANRDKNVYFSLLTDFRDAPQETMPNDEALVRQAITGVEMLNRRYQADRPNIFYLFHRPRQWNAAEGAWMGYERKRGKLTQFNGLLRGHGAESFSEIIGDRALLSQMRYVITLDTDTQLPRDAARNLVGTMAHPLNRPLFDPKTDLVTEGYSILQPRVGVSLPSANRSWFVRIFAGDAGIDPYTRAVSDVYQDVFGEGSFIGKGIYDVDAFERAVHHRFPDNTILSHDLIESLHARSGLISDVEFFEEHPSRYNADINRRHRWIRGDWQIAQWLLPRVPGADARRVANTLSGLSQWKIFDNLRRSLVPAALTFLLLADWLWLPELQHAGTYLVLAIFLIPSLLSITREFFSKPEEWPLLMHLHSWCRSAAKQVAQISLTIIFLPYDAYVSLDAIARTLVRLLFTRRQLLEWQTSSDAERTARTDIAGFYEMMWVAPALALATLVVSLFVLNISLPIAIPFLCLWLVAPALAWWISSPISHEPPKLTAKQLQFLGQTARKTWRYFEAFAGASENWLPADNFQERPMSTIAARTSPTNIGMALLANLAAHDFGYISVTQVIDRTTKTLTTLDRLERHRGHFYNWYDTRTLRPLEPRYISMVDSGNLSGHLFILKAGLIEYIERPILCPQVFTGLHDTFNVLCSLAPATPQLTAMGDLFNLPAPGQCGAYAALSKLVSATITLEAQLGGETEEVKWWLQSLKQSAQDHLDELLLLSPWLPQLTQSNISQIHQSDASPKQFFPANDATPIDLAAALTLLDKIPTLEGVVKLNDVFESLAAQKPPVAGLEPWLNATRAGAKYAEERIRTLQSLAAQAENLADMDFEFLFDPVRELFTIGYSVADRRRDQSFYDLLASEARLGSYVAIAQNQIPQKHWFTLGRLLAASRGEPVLVSWSGSMFEYLMPMLVMPSYDGTILDQTCFAAVRAQIEYGRTRGTPWGVSESGYNLTDAQLNYQYRAFGVPGLGFKRGLAEDLVIAPYASAMALMVAPREACENLERLAADGRSGDYGFYEAVDYTPSRVPPNETSITIRSFMAHHQGMSLLALVYLLRDRPMQRRFLTHAPFKAEELLLQERVPRAVATLFSEDVEFTESRPILSASEGIMRIISTPHTATPEVHLLSNGRYHVMISNSGGGYSRWKDLSLTRWREDSTRDCFGSFCYLRDADSGEYWSLAYQPTQQIGRKYEAIFTQARAEFRQRHGVFETHAEISISPEDDVEVRRLTINNYSNVPRQIELTTYAEVVLASAGADVAHPAFSNLFVQTEFIATHPALLCTRRPRTEGERPPWMFALLAVQGAESGELSYETDRSKFIGRGRNLAEPLALKTSGPLSNSIGAVLDPIVSLRRVITIPPQGAVKVEIVMGAAEQRDTAISLIEKYHNLRMGERLFDLAWTHSQVTLRHLDCAESDAQLYSRMAGSLVYSNPLRRANASVLASNKRGQSGLWSYGISGDTPIVLLRINDSEKMDLVRRVVQAHAYWRMKGLAVELVILNEDTSVYRQSLHDLIVNMIASGSEAQLLDKPGGIFVRRLEQMPAEDRVLLQSVARIILSDDKGSLTEQMEKRAPLETETPYLKTSETRERYVETELPPRKLTFPNGLGGFTSDGREYVISLQADRFLTPRPKSNSLLRLPAWRADRDDTDLVSTTLPRSTAANENTPAPWVNVLANDRFGTVVSESGSAYTWLDNSHEFRLTPWNNDPVSDISGEAFYIRDEETGEFWSPTPWPARGATPYVVRHGFGYTVFEHTENGIASEAWVYVAKDAPVKFTVIKLRNVSHRPRQLSVTGYWEWVLGDLRAKSALHVNTEIDPATSAVLARNAYNTEFADRIAFVDVSDPSRTITGDRREFIGRNGSLNNPQAMKKVCLSGKVGAGIDPCTAVQVKVELLEQKDKEISFRMGAAASLAEAQGWIRHFRQPQMVRGALQDVRAYWNHTLQTVQVETPNAATNFLANGWLMYQTLSARLWGRTGFYQSGGAFGFRDQLQDAMALVHAEPRLLREQLLRAASRQFREGDVQHWWHPPSGRGVRTHFSDDYLWLPYAACRYVQSLGDTGILDEKVQFLEGRALKPEEESVYDLPMVSPENGTLYEHCVRSIKYGLKFGVHGMPLIGCGDWNDGFNMIGEHGKGESVWLAFFLYEVLTQFSELARKRNDVDFATHCLTQAETLRLNIEKNTWDGQWYCRAYFDNGDPVGSHANQECQIDSLPQSWSVITSAVDPARATQAMDSVEQRLVRRQAGLIQLFDPPFDKSSQNPGYIKGYVPGVRENGGQYTHGAIWTVMAFALLGKNDLAWEMFLMMNPINHSNTPEKIAIYKVEPYVVAADVYAVEPHVGRGGWTWYTGSAGWMYRLITETLLGLKIEGEMLKLEPHLPGDWTSYKIHYRFRETLYHLDITQVKALEHQPLQIKLDGVAQPGESLRLVDDRREHLVEIRVGPQGRKPGRWESLPELPAATAVV